MRCTFLHAKAKGCSEKLFAFRFHPSQDWNASLEMVFSQPMAQKMSYPVFLCAEAGACTTQRRCVHCRTARSAPHKTEYRLRDPAAWLPLATWAGSCNLAASVFSLTPVCMPALFRVMTWHPRQWSSHRSTYIACLPAGYLPTSMPARYTQHGFIRDSVKFQLVYF